MAAIRPQRQRPGLARRGRPRLPPPGRPLPPALLLQEGPIARLQPGQDLGPRRERPIGRLHRAFGAADFPQVLRALLRLLLHVQAARPR